MRAFSNGVYWSIKCTSTQGLQTTVTTQSLTWYITKSQHWFWIIFTETLYKYHSWLPQFLTDQGYAVIITVAKELKDALISRKTQHSGQRRILLLYIRVIECKFDCWNKWPSLFSFDLHSDWRIFRTQINFYGKEDAQLPTPRIQYSESNIRYNANQLQFLKFL